MTDKSCFDEAYRAVSAVAVPLANHSPTREQAVTIASVFLHFAIKFFESAYGPQGAAAQLYAQADALATKGREGVAS